MKKLTTLFCFLAFTCFISWSQSYNFTCTVVDPNNRTVETDMPGVMKLTTNEYGQYVILVEVKSKTGKGPLPFGFWTEPSSGVGISYAKNANKDGRYSVHDLYYIENIKENERLVVAVTYDNNTPDEISLIYVYNNKVKKRLQIPYTEAAYKGIYGIIEASKSKINYRQGTINDFN